MEPMQPPTLTIDRLLDLAEAHVRNILLKKKEADVMPVFMVQGRTGKVGLLLAPFRDHQEKHEMMASAIAVMRQHDVVRYGFVTGAWAAATPKGFKLGDQPAIMPSQDPQRREIVVALASEGIETKYRVWNVTRGKGGKVTALSRDLETVLSYHSHFALLMGDPA